MHALSIDSARSVPMTNGTGARRRHASMSCFFMAMALAAMPGPVEAQDDRNDELPEHALGFAQTPGTRAGSPIKPGLWAEPHLIANFMQLAVDRFGDSGPTKEGFYPELSNMITGSGWVSLGPGYRHYVFNKQAFIDSSAAVSWHLYKMVQARFEAPDFADRHLTVGIQTMWQDQTQINFYGIGPNSLQSNQSQYGMKTIDTVAYGAYRPEWWLSIGGEAGWVYRPDVTSPGGTFGPNVPETQVLFPTDPGVGLAFQPTYLHAEGSVTADTRDHRGRPTEGGLYRVALTAYQDQSTGAFSFNQYEAEAAHFFRVTGPSWILALHGWTVYSDVPSNNEIPFYLLPSLGGQNTLRSFSDYRFHDQNLLNASVESRWQLFTHVDGAIFLDTGNVAPRFGDLNLDKTSVGGGFRLHTDTMTWARLDVAHGSEGWNVVFRTSDPFRLSRLTRRVAAIPFVP
jgi:hypothetical protein